jgi:hypothetical protein
MCKKKLLITLKNFLRQKVNKNLLIHEIILKKIESIKKEKKNNLKDKKYQRRKLLIK